MRVGIIGYGQFGRFMAEHLAPHHEVSAYDQNGSGTHSLAETCSSDILVFAVPVQRLRDAATSAKPFVAHHTLVADVSSVKERALDVLASTFPSNQILGTHPIFGPQSGKHGIQGLPVVLVNVSWKKDSYATLKSFLSDKLKLKVIERTAREHDKEMARVQGLAHFIGRALKALKITDYETGTQSYHHLVELRDLLQDDSWELFTTIQNENVHAKEVREEFLAALNELEEKLGSGEAT